LKPTIALILFLVCSSGTRAGAQCSTFAGDPQHTAQFPVPALHLNHVRWSAGLGSSFVHYGAPLVTTSNTVLFATITNSSYTLQAYEGATGRLKYTLTNDFRSSGESSWSITYGPALTAGPNGTRLYYPGIAGTVFYIDNPDSDAPDPPTRLCFYEPISTYATNSSSFTNRIYINTPITADTNGTIFFGFRTLTAAPAPLSTISSGFARIAQDGTGSYVLTTNAANNTAVTRDVPNCAPALSNDGATLYVPAMSPLYLLGLDATTLATKYNVQLRDPRNHSSNATPADNSTASPTVGPDGDIYYGVYASSSSVMGYMLHFSGDLATQKLPSLFGWDYTAAIVPTNIVKGYRGTSPYLLFSKYNNYNASFYRNAVLDPNAGLVSQSIQVMREVLTVTSPSSGNEWCVSTPAVCAAGASVFSPNEDGRVYRWDLSANCLVEAISLHGNYGEPYVSTVQGPDGAVYTISGNRLYAMDNLTNLSITVSSSNPDERLAVRGQPITFTAVVTNPAADPVATGTIDFLDGAAVIATNVPLVNGLASTTTSNLIAGPHFINVNYSGDTSYPTGAVTLIQRIHANTSTLTLTSSVPFVGGTLVTLTAVVASPGGGTPTGTVTFWDQNTYLAQLSLVSGRASFTTNFSPGIHAMQAEYSSDGTYAACAGAMMATPAILTSPAITPDGSFQFGFTNFSGASFLVLGTTDLSLPVSSWQVLGNAVEVAPGSFQFTDPPAATLSGEHFYAVRSP